MLLYCTTFLAHFLCNFSHGFEVAHVTRSLGEHQVGRYPLRSLKYLEAKYLEYQTEKSTNYSAITQFEFDITS